MSYQDTFAAKLAKIELEYRAKIAAATVEAEVVCALVGLGLPEPETVSVHAGNHVSAKILVPKVVGEYRDYTGAGPVESAILLAMLTGEGLLKMDPARSDRTGCVSLYPAEAREGREEFVSEGVQYEACLRQTLFGEIAGSYDLQYTCLELTWWVKAAGKMVEIIVPVSGVPSEYVVTKLRNRSPKGFNKPHIPGSKQIAFGGKTGVDVNYLFATIEDALDGLSPMSVKEAS